MKTTRTDRRQNINTYKVWVYGLYKDGSLIYVGVTADPAFRLVSHQKTKDFDEMRLVKGFSSRERAEQYENLCIQTFPNLINIVRKTPRPVGFKPRMPHIASRDFSAWHSKTPSDFDFDALNNETVQRRVRWSEGLTRKN